MGLHEWLESNRCLTAWVERYSVLDCDHDGLHYVTADGWCLICGEPA